ncbi:hypothetical protein PHLCEN_2v1673 [Hermanssonia centrifuga]|uniref:Uncharacterized protein n=1 Tax=Hermanssonia centrifuga TaxID=98765 RepID=A0A2R6RZC6_9APHY|nr:hypothetical protein PHLCEN_2v1673 [Hermanssonia centrifuga]
MKGWIRGAYDNTLRLDPLSPIGACLLSLSLLSERPSDVDIRTEWLSLWSRMGDAVRKYASLAETSSAENCELATECLLRLHRYEADEAFLENEDEDQRYSRWLDGFRVEDSLFPDSLIEGLQSFIPADEYGRFRRVRRICDLKSSVKELSETEECVVSTEQKTGKVLE